MSYELGCVEVALKEWNKLDNNTRAQFKKKLAERCINPREPSAQLSGSRDRYKIKLRSAGYRLVYEVRDEQLIIVVIAVGKRDLSEAYKAAASRKVPSKAE